VLWVLGGRADRRPLPQMIVHVISFAFLMVLASTAMLSPVLLYVFGLADLGWRWEHAAMFSAILASTDAVAVSAVLKSGALPRLARRACSLPVALDRHAWAPGVAGVVCVCWRRNP